MPTIANLRNVRALGEHPPAYLVDLDLDLGDGPQPATCCARPGGGGVVDLVLAEIAAGRFAGALQPYAPPPPEPATSRPLDRKRWLWALRRFGLRAGLDAAIAEIAATEPERAADLDAAIYGSSAYRFEDVVALLAANQATFAIAAPPIAALTPPQLAAMWGEALTKTFDTGE